MDYGIDAIRKFKTRQEDATIFDAEGKIIAKIPMARLPVDELLNYLNMFERLDKTNPNAMFKKDVLERLFNYMEISILSANDGISSEETREFIATNFFGLFETFMKVNGGGIKIEGEIPENVKKQLEDM